MAAAELVVGQETLEDVGLEVSSRPHLAEALKAALASEFVEQVEKWQECLEHLLAAPIDFHRGGEKQTVGSVLMDFEGDDQGLDLKYAQERLALAGLGLLRAEGPGAGPFLAVPSGKHPALNKIFQDTDFFEGGWSMALKQAPEGVVRQGTRAKVVKIQRVAKYCLLVDLAAYDKLSEKG